MGSSNKVRIAGWQAKWLRTACPLSGIPLNVYDDVVDIYTSDLARVIPDQRRFNAFMKGDENEFYRDTD